MTIEVPTASGSKMSAYMALPIKKKGPVVIVLQEIFGVTDAMKAYCDYLAARQFTAICPELYWSEAPGKVFSEDDPDTARAVRQKMDDNTVTDDIAAAIDFMRGHETSTGTVGVLGFCWGGLLAYLTAVRHTPDVAVGYYGTGIDKKLDLAKDLHCPLALHYGGQDKMASPEAAAAVRDAFKDDKRVIVYEYPDAGHAFARRGGKPYHHPSADLADMRSLSFMIDKLWGKGVVS